MGFSTVLCKAFARRMCKNFKRSTKCDKKSPSGFNNRGNFKRFLPQQFFFTRTGSHCQSDQEICIQTAREAFQPIYVTDITKKFPSEILMPFVSAKQELGEVNILGHRGNPYVSDSCLSVDCEENVADMFAWVYDMDVTENNSSKISSTAVCDNWLSWEKERTKYEQRSSDNWMLDFNAVFVQEPATHRYFWRLKVWYALWEMVWFFLFSKTNQAYGPGNVCWLTRHLTTLLSHP